MSVEEVRKATTKNEVLTNTIKFTLTKWPQSTPEAIEATSQ